MGRGVRAKCQGEFSQGHPGQLRRAVRLPVTLVWAPGPADTHALKEPGAWFAQPRLEAAQTQWHAAKPVKKRGGAR